MIWVMLWIVTGLAFYIGFKIADRKSKTKPEGYEKFMRIPAILLGPIFMVGLVILVTVDKILEQRDKKK